MSLLKQLKPTTSQSHWTPLEYFDTLEDWTIFPTKLGAPYDNFDLIVRNRPVEADNECVGGAKHRTRTRLDVSSAVETL